MSRDIQLSKRLWRIGDEFASGGFARVHDAEADDGSPAVIKLVPKVPGADRELLFESLGGVPNVIPVLDTGEVDDSYALAMPKADKSLREYLDEIAGPADVDLAIPILADIVHALSALATLNVTVVHRDIKPENILLFQGHWCLCDFGIARYAEATTSPDTRKFMMTPPYAAPEQWRQERATTATDVYSFGVLAFEMLQGERPFAGPSQPEFRDQHLHVDSPPLAGCPSSIAAVVTECLYKAAEARPTAANISTRLKSSARPASPAALRLQEVNRTVVERRSAEATVASAVRTESERRSALVDPAEKALTTIVRMLRESIEEHAPTAVVTSSRDAALSVTLNEATLVVTVMRQGEAGGLAVPAYSGAIDVIGYSSIVVRKPADRYGYQGREHSLWYCDAHDERAYRLFELAFMRSVFSSVGTSLVPFGLSPDGDAASALGPGGGGMQLAWQPIPVDQGEEAQFVERWLGWLAMAADGSLGHPTNLPENSGGKYRYQQPPPR